MRYQRGVLLVIVAAILWSGNGLAVRFIETATPWHTLFWRSVAMAPIVIGFIVWRSDGALFSKLRGVGPIGVLGGLSLVLAFGGGIYAISTTTIANAVFLLSATPFLAAVLGWVLLREPVHPGTWLAIIVAGLGMFITVREGLAIGAMQGNIAALLSALGFAMFTVTLRYGKIDDTMPIVLLGALFSIVAAAVVLRLEGHSVAAVPAHDIMVAMLMGVVILATGMILYTLGSKVVPASELALFSMMEVLLGPFWVWLFLGETASTGTLIGGCLILAAVVGNALYGVRRSTRPVPQ